MQRPTLITTYVSSDREVEEEDQEGRMQIVEEPEAPNEMAELKKKQKAMEEMLLALHSRLTSGASKPPSAPDPGPALDPVPTSDPVTFAPYLEEAVPRGAPGSLSRTSISMRGSRLWTLNRDYRNAYSEMCQRIQEVGRLGDYCAGRHQRDVDVTITVKSTQSEDSVTYELEGLEPDHVTNLLRLQISDLFKRMADDSVLTDQFTEEELRTGTESKDRRLTTQAVDEFAKRNNGWSPKAYFGEFRTYGAMARAGKKRKRANGVRYRKRDIAQTDCYYTQERRNAVLQEVIRDLQAQLAEREEKKPAL